MSSEAHYFTTARIGPGKAWRSGLVQTSGTGFDTNKTQ